MTKICFKELDSFCKEKQIEITDENFSEIISNFLKETKKKKIKKQINLLRNTIGYENFIVCGSFALNYFELLDREPEDLDIYSDIINEHSSSEIFPVDKKGSGSFLLKDAIVHCQTFSTKFGKIDCFTSKDYSLDYIKVIYESSPLLIEKPLGALKAKVAYLETGEQASDKINKHTKDLDQIKQKLSHIFEL